MSGHSTFKTLNHGFTLIEMMVVMLILSVVMGFSLLSPRSANHKYAAQEQALRLERLFAQLRDRALLDHAVYGFSLVGKEGYQWSRFSAQLQQWQPLQEKPFHPYQLPDGVALDLAMVGPAIASQRLTSVVYPGNSPDIVLFSDLQMTPVELTLSSATGSATLVSSGVSDVYLQP